MTSRYESYQKLAEIGVVMATRKDVVLFAFGNGININTIHRLTGIARTTIYKWLKEEGYKFNEN